LRGGSRTSGCGDVLLIRNNQLVWQKKIPRPIQACVSNNGIVGICDIGFGPDLQSNIVVLRLDGSMAVNRMIGANLLSCASTPSGDVIFFNSAGSPTSEDSVKLFAFSLPTGNPIFVVDFVIQELHSAFSSTDQFSVIADGITYQYSRSGELMNKFQTEIALFDRNMSARYFATAHHVLEGCMKGELQADQHGQLKAAYEKLSRSDAMPDVKAKAHRDLGELCLADGDKVRALAEFREALKLNPKIGLKRKLAEIEQNMPR
jgi:hypothetical protein